MVNTILAGKIDSVSVRSPYPPDDIFDLFVCMLTHYIARPAADQGYL